MLTRYLYCFLSAMAHRNIVVTTVGCPRDMDKLPYFISGLLTATQHCMSVRR